MPEQIQRLSPHRDLQCYFLQPSAIAAMSNASATGFTVSGSFRTAWDWAVVEWNADNGFEHPALRYLPEMQSDSTGTNYKKAGDFTGVTLSYVEQRTNCMPFESNLYPTLDWPYLRVWVPLADGTDQVYFVRLSDYAQPVINPGSNYVSAQVTMTLTGPVTPSLRVGLAFMGTFASDAGNGNAPAEQHYYFTPSAGMTLAQVAAGIANAINDPNSGSPDINAVANGNSVICTYAGAGALANKTGANGNRVGCYGFSQYGSQTTWVNQFTTFTGGKFPEQYQITLNFDNLQGVTDPPQFFQHPVPYVAVPTMNVRKMRWMWAPDITPLRLQIGPFQRAEWSVTFSNWTVTDNYRIYSVAGPGSRRIEDTDTTVVYSATGGDRWTVSGPGNFSGGRVTTTNTPGDTCTISYTEAASHRLYLGVGRVATSAQATVTIDGGTPQIFNLGLPGEDVLVRLPLGPMSAGSHTVVVTQTGSQGQPLAFDFLEIAYPTQNLPDIPAQTNLSLATDWDTLHSQALPAERTAWMINKLGFQGRVNHYVGAIWWYELWRPGQQFASLTATIAAPSSPSGVTEIDLGDRSQPSTVTKIQHVNLPDDNSTTIAQALAFRINQGAAAVWASAQGNVLTINWRFIQNDPASPQAPLPVWSPQNWVYLSATELQGGTPGTTTGYADYDAYTKNYRTDLNYSARINRACRDWSQGFFTALQGYGIDCVAAFSTELSHVDPTAAAGMAQRYPDGTPVILNTPAVQTNFSPTSIAFWTAVYVNMAKLQIAAGMTPYLQSGEVQWWYFPNSSGMPFYDDYTKQQFTTTYGTQMGTIPNGGVPVSQFPNEAAFLNSELTNFTATMRNAINQINSNARYEVLYPCDVNDPTVYPFNQAVNLATTDWRPSNLTCFKTEALSYLGERNLDKTAAALQVGLGFPANQRSHLLFITDPLTAWAKEVALAQAHGMESVVLFALDQFCLIGYPLPPFTNQRWSRRAA